MANHVRGPRLANRYRQMPKKGTYRRQMLMGLLRPQGMSPHEGDQIGESRPWGTFMSYMRVLVDEQGWEIVQFKRPSQKKTNQKLESVYRIVGRHRPDGSYRDYSRWTLPT